MNLDGITEGYYMRAELWLLITTLVYFLMNGAQIFESAVVVPKWTASPSASFHLFKGAYGLDFKRFWIAFHSLHEITFILAIVFCWKLDVRNSLLILFAIHMAVRAWTLLYFAPRIIEFQKIEPIGTPTPDLMDNTSRWRKLNYLRVAVFIGVSIAQAALYIKLSWEM